MRWVDAYNCFFRILISNDLYMKKMSRHVFFTAAAVVLVLTVAAQPSAKWALRSLNQVGLLQGEGKAAVDLQTVNGLQRRNLFIGVGAGLDYYRYRSVPLFLQAMKYFGKSNNQFFLYANAGAHFVWKNKEDIYERYHPGFYGGAGIGYKAGFRNGMGFLLNAGYSYKRVNNEADVIISCPINGPCYPYTSRYHYDLNRLIIQIGWMF